jgi:hypothetical protein
MRFSQGNSLLIIKGLKFWYHPVETRSGLPIERVFTFPTSVQKVLNIYVNKGSRQGDNGRLYLLQKLAHQCQSRCFTRIRSSRMFAWLLLTVESWINLA